MFLRPCETIIKFASGGQLTPDDICILAGGGDRFANWILKTKGLITGDEIIQVAEAIHDNWKRFWESA